MTFDPTPMKRIADLDVATLSPEQSQAHAAIASGPRGGVRGPLAVWLHRPELAMTAQALGQYCRYETSLPARLSELVIIVTGACWQSAYEWEAHAPLALQAGIAPDIVDAIRDGLTPRFAARDEQTVFDFVTTLHRTRTVPDELYQRAVDVLGQDAVVDLVGVAGYYTLISMTINVFGIEAKRAVNFGGGRA
jgi:4-carboxymuconolactone decarboxylase